MLKTRILTALIIFPATVALVFLAPAWLFRGVLAILLLVGTFEFTRVLDLSSNGGRLLVVLQIALLGAMLLLWPHIQAWALPVLAGGCAAWALMFLSLRSYRDGQSPDMASRRFGFFSALAAVSVCWFSVSWLRDRPDGEFVVFTLLLVIWASDVGAYFSGKFLGRRKLAPLISPNKTWEGVYGGILLALAATFLWSDVIARLEIPALALVVMSIVTTLTSVGGDLFISMQKRTVKLDDTGNIFPGHGGVLDRYDSLLAGASFFALAFGLLAR